VEQEKVHEQRLQIDLGFKAPATVIMTMRPIVDGERALVSREYTLSLTTATQLGHALLDCCQHVLDEHGRRVIEAAGERVVDVKLGNH